MAANFQNILNTRADTVEAPKALPVGKFQGTVKGFETGESTKKKTPYVEITFIIHSALDIAPENQEQADTAFAKGPVEMSTSFYLSDKAMYRLVEFVENDLGIARGGKTLADLLTESVGQDCALILDVETTTSGKEYVGIKRTAPLG